MKTLRWLLAIHKARSWYLFFGFAKRQVFLKELRPIIDDGTRYAYPDAIFIITDEDVGRAVNAALDYKPSPLTATTP